MSYTYADRKRADRTAPQTQTAQQPSMDALRSGAAQPTAEQMGHRVDLPDAMRSKMENAFGADLSAVKLYESQAVADAGAKAMAQGASIAFAPGLLDFTSYGGQALLGHEISHVVSQARGEVTGGGFLNDASLEARADREGAMAAAGQTVAMPTAAMSSVSAAAAAGPMQAKKVPYEQQFEPNAKNKTGSLKDRLSWRKEQLSWQKGPLGALARLGQKKVPESSSPSEILMLPESDAAQAYNMEQYQQQQAAQPANQPSVDPDIMFAMMGQQVDELGGPSGSEEIRRRAAVWGDWLT